MTNKQILLTTVFISIWPFSLLAMDNYLVTKDLNVRTGAGTNYVVSFTLQKGDEVELLSKNGNWYKINYIGKIGYAHSKYLTKVSETNSNTIEQSGKTNSVFGILLIFGVTVFIWLFNRRIFEFNRKRRRDYYREYLKSDDWKRKRYVVLKRDNWRCVYCGGRATQVHHKRYAKYNIGKEPIEWLVSVCKSCHDSQHQ